MKTVPINYADFGLVKVKSTNKCTPTPHCKIHGAMNKMNVLDDGGGYWRCISAISSHNNTACRAGCCEVRPFVRLFLNLKKLFKSKLT